MALQGGPLLRSHARSSSNASMAVKRSRVALVPRAVLAIRETATATAAAPAAAAPPVPAAAPALPGRPHPVVVVKQESNLQALESIKAKAVNRECPSK